MSKDKKSLIDLVPDSVDNAVKNITNKPTQNMGTTLADIWYLVFGGISQAAEKRKLKYSYALQEFEKELKEKMSKIPEDKLIEPDIQIIAPALESAKYCIENIELRNMFSNLISSSLNIDLTDFSQPIFIDIIRNLKPLDCKILNSLYKETTLNFSLPTNFKQLGDFFTQLYISFNKLNSYGLIRSQETIINFEDISNEMFEYWKKYQTYRADIIFQQNKFYKQISYHETTKNNCILSIELDPFTITPLGVAFKRVCIQ